VLGSRRDNAPFGRKLIDVGSMTERKRTVSRRGFCRARKIASDEFRTDFVYAHRFLRGSTLGVQQPRLDSSTDIYRG
jgi:hypothetical protein